MYNIYIVDFLRNPEKFTRLGGKMTKGTSIHCYRTLLPVGNSSFLPSSLELSGRKVYEP